MTTKYGSKTTEARPTTTPSQRPYSKTTRLLVKNFFRSNPTAALDSGSDFEEADTSTYDTPYSTPFSSRIHQNIEKKEESLLTRQASRLPRIQTSSDDTNVPHTLKTPALYNGQLYHAPELLDTIYENNNSDQEGPTKGQSNDDSRNVSTTNTPNGTPILDFIPPPFMENSAETKYAHRQYSPQQDSIFSQEEHESPHLLNIHGTKSKRHKSNSPFANDTGLARMFREILPDRNMIGQSIFFLVCSSILQLYIPKLIGDYIDRLGGTSARNTNPNIDIDKFALNRIVLLMVITVSVLCLFNFLWMVMIWCIGDRIVARLRRHLFQCIIYREIGFFDHYRTGELVSRLSSDVNAVNNAITVEVAELTQRTVIFLGAISYTQYLSWDLTLIAIAIAPLLGVVGSTMARYFHAIARAANDELARSNTVAEESISCVRTVRSFSQEELIYERYNGFITRTLHLMYKQKIAMASQKAFVYYAGSLAVSMILWYGATKVSNKEMSPGEQITFILFGVQVGEKSGEILDNWSHLRTATGASQRVFRLIDEGQVEQKLRKESNQVITDEMIKNFWESKGRDYKEIQDYYKINDEETNSTDTSYSDNVAIDMTTSDVAEQLLAEKNSSDAKQNRTTYFLDRHSGDDNLVESPPISGIPATSKHLLLPLVLKDIWFRYPSRPDKWILRGLNLTIEPGQAIALVGPSGGGKSTVVSLFEGFYTPSYGTITWGDTDISRLEPKWFHRQVGYVGQEPVLFCSSIRDNILFGVNSDKERKKITQEDIERATKAANAHDFIMTLTNGYDTIVGERGTQLSGGQKQRIAIARAVLMNPPLLILDEATSALDSESERLVQNALDKLMQRSKEVSHNDTHSRLGRSTLMIAHRLSTVRNADQIVVVAGGKVVERGTHEEQLQQKGMYANLISHQLTNDISDTSTMNEYDNSKSSVESPADATDTFSNTSYSTHQGNANAKIEKVN